MCVVTCYPRHAPVSISTVQQQRTYLLACPWVLCRGEAECVCEQRGARMLRRDNGALLCVLFCSCYADRM